MSGQALQVYKISGIMLAVAFVSATVLTLVHSVTEKPIAEAKNRLIAESVASVISSEFDNNPFEEKTIIRRGKEKYILYPARKDGYITSIVMQSYSNKGFGGKLEVIVGFRPDGIVSGYNVFKHQETPGLGSKVNDESFKKNILGQVPQSESFKVRQDGGEIDAITGATITSRALIDAIQRAYQGYVKFNTGN